MVCQQLYIKISIIACTVKLGTLCAFLSLFVVNTSLSFVTDQVSALNLFDFKYE